jgi:hypothetical protein
VNGKREAPSTIWLGLERPYSRNRDALVAYPETGRYIHAMSSLAWSLSRIFGSGVRYFHTRPAFHAYGWMPAGFDDVAAAIRADAQTGEYLTVAGEMTVHCSRGVLTDVGAELLAEAGVGLPERVVPFSSQRECMENLRAFGKEQARVAFHDVLPTEDCDPGCYWVPYDLLRFLNNKANLGKIVPDAHVARRTVVPRSAFANLSSFAEPFGWPLILKVASDEPTGGGYGVRTCSSLDELERAVREFRCDQIVLEELLPMARNLSVQMVATQSGEIHVVGAGEQMSDESGLYRGSWIVPPDELPAEAVEVARLTTANAMKMGYWGMAGVEVALLADRQAKAFDLNFRPNLSMVGHFFCLNQPRRVNGAVRLIRRFESDADLASIAPLVKELAREGVFYPLVTYDPHTVARGDGSSILGLVLGGTRTEVAAREAQFAERGFGKAREVATRGFRVHE